MKTVIAVGLILCLLSSQTLAQSTDTPPATDQSAETAPPQSQQEPEQQVAQEEDDEDDENEDSLSRFIPTEQISQDLGVSFPADI